MGFITYRVNKSAIGFSVEPYPGTLSEIIYIQPALESSILSGGC